MARLFHDQDFINPDGKGDGAYYLSTVDSGWGKKGRNKPESYNIKIADCSRQINLHGMIGGKKKRKIAVEKINRLIKGLEKIKEYIINVDAK